jgi:beta-phosphoglucomutase-like phosphatase (HAD superfamily)
VLFYFLFFYYNKNMLDFKVKNIEALFIGSSENLFDNDPQAAGVLKSVHHAGVKIGVVRNEDPTSVANILAGAGMSDVVGYIVNRDDIVEPILNTDGIRMAAEFLGVSLRNCVYLGDAVNDVAASLEANLATQIAFSPDATYDEGVARMRAAGAEYWIRDWVELPSKLLQIDVLNFPRENSVHPTTTSDA